MLFFEASAKTGHNIEQVFEQSAIEIARKIEENCYDLTNESCGINNESSGGNMKLNKQTKNSDSKKKVLLDFIIMRYNINNIQNIININ